MNLWECGADGCHRTVIGVGSAIGLRAIGWYWGGTGSHYIRCPIHRPDSVPCHDLYPEGGDHCHLCAAEDEAARWQRVMGYDRETGECRAQVEAALIEPLPPRNS